MFAHRPPCTHRSCRATAGRIPCQDCRRPFCAQHVAATDFAGYRAGTPGRSQWTRFVCRGCADEARSAAARAGAIAQFDAAQRYAAAIDGASHHA